VLKVLRFPSVTLFLIETTAWRAPQAKGFAPDKLSPMSLSSCTGACDTYGKQEQQLESEVMAFG
jgi:hypothetical protein